MKIAKYNVGLSYHYMEGLKALVDRDGHYALPVGIYKYGFSDITLLSVNEYNTYKDNIPDVNYDWMLRTPNEYREGNRVCVTYWWAAHKNFNAQFVNDEMNVRPALVFNDGLPQNIEVGNKFNFAGHRWTIISNNLALCDESIGRSVFNSDRTNNDYDTSEIKVYLHDWANANGLLL